MLNIIMIKTDKGCFITDCKVTSGYDYDYHKTQIDKLLFNGELATKTYVKNWMFVKEYPTTVQKTKPDYDVNIRWELKNKDMESKVLPITRYDMDGIDYDDPIRDLYTRFADREKGGLEDVEVEFDVVLEVENFEFPPDFKYDWTDTSNFQRTPRQITKANIKHQLLDKLIIPEILLHNTPCEISSVDLYRLVREHVKKNIDNTCAKITSDYDFCFSVKKLIPLFKPREYTYTNPFASTKKARQKVNHAVDKFREVEIFQMTDDKQNYKGYSPIKPITANSEQELKEKIDFFLDELMKHINEPLIACSCCDGKGYLNESLKDKL